MSPATSHRYIEIKEIGPIKCMPIYIGNSEAYTERDWSNEPPLIIPPSLCEQSDQIHEKQIAEVIKSCCHTRPMVDDVTTLNFSDALIVIEFLAHGQKHAPGNDPDFWGYAILNTIETLCSQVRLFWNRENYGYSLFHKRLAVCIVLAKTKVNPDLYMKIRLAELKLLSTIFESGANDDDGYFGFLLKNSNTLTYFACSVCEYHEKAAEKNDGVAGYIDQIGTIARKIPVPQYGLLLASIGVALARYKANVLLEKCATIRRHEEKGRLNFPFPERNSRTVLVGRPSDAGKTEVKNSALFHQLVLLRYESEAARTERLLGRECQSSEDLLDVSYELFRDGYIGENLSAAVPAICVLAEKQTVDSDHSQGGLMMSRTQQFLGPFLEAASKDMSAGFSTVSKWLYDGSLRATELGYGNTVSEIFDCLLKMEKENSVLEQVVNLIVKIVKAQLDLTRLTLPDADISKLWPECLTDYISAMRMADGKVGYLDLYTERMKLASQVSLLDYLSDIRKKDNSISNYTQRALRKTDDQLFIGKVLAAKHAMDLSHASALCQRDANNESISVLARYPQFMRQYNADNADDFGQSLFKDLRHFLRDDSADYLEYMVTKDSVYRVWIYNRGEDYRVDNVAQGDDYIKLRKLSGLYIKNGWLEEGQAVALAKILCPSIHEMDNSQRLIVAGNYFLQGLNYRNLFSAQLGYIPNVSQVLSGPNYIELKTRYRDRQAKCRDEKACFLWQFVPVTPEKPDKSDPVLRKLTAELGRIVGVDIITPESNVPTTSRTGIIAVHGKQRHGLSADLLMSPDYWISPSEIIRSGGIPLSEDIVLSLGELQFLWIIACVSGKVEPVFAETGGFIRAFLERGPVCVIGSLIDVRPQGDITKMIQIVARRLKEGEAPASAVTETMRELCKGKEDYSVTKPGSNGDWPVVWGCGFEEGLFARKQEI